MTRHPTVLLCLFASLALAGCDDTTDTGAGTRIQGTSSALGGGTVTTWATSDGQGGVTEVGATLPLAVFAATQPQDVSIDFPDVVKKTTYFQHLYFNHLPTGHGPPPYMLPHLDLHFLGIQAATREAIDCAAEVTPAATLLPPNYVIPSLLPEAQGGTCVPKMGVHAIDVTSPELAPTNPATFTRTLIFGYHKGDLIFVEPMVTRAFFEARQAFTIPIPKPAKLGRTVRWPSTFEATFDAATNAWSLKMTGFTTIQ